MRIEISIVVIYLFLPQLCPRHSNDNARQHRILNLLSYQGTLVVIILERVLTGQSKEGAIWRARMFYNMIMI